MDLANFFSAAEARMDRWSQLNTTARSWESAVKGSRPTDKLKAEAVSICDELEPLEALWAYPGPKLMGTLKERLVSGDAVGFARITQKVTSALLSESYRRDPGAWEPEEEGEQVGTLGRYARIARLRFDEGYTSYLEVLDAERSLFNAQLSYAQTQGTIFQSLVNVYKAMGGGWVVEADKMTGLVIGEKGE